MVEFDFNWENGIIGKIFNGHSRLIIILTTLLISSAYSVGNAKTYTFCTLNEEDQRLFRNSHAILNEAFKRLGHEFELKTYPAKRCSIECDKGTVDGDSHRIFDFNADNKHPNLIRVDESIHSIDHSIFTKKKNIVVNDWESIKPYSVIYVAGVKIIENGLKKINIPDTNRRPVYSHEKGFVLLNANRGDLLIISSFTGNQLLRKMGLVDSGIKMLTPPLDIFELYPYMHRKNKDVAEQLAVVLREMKTDGSYQNIIGTIHY